ncbi:hypothetical protein GCM10020254_02470 [Streptomyces goshikiensis]
MRESADRLLDALGPHGTTDLMASYAAPLPIIVICDLLGVPEEHRRDFRVWTDALIAPDPARPAAAKEAVAAMLGFFLELVAHKRERPGADLLSDLVAVRDSDGDRLTEDELLSLAFLILVAGYENTVQLIGNAVLALLRHPYQLAVVRKDPSRLRAAVEEAARYEGPALLAIRRFATEDVTLSGVTVPAGETVLLSLAAANRDPDRFSGPDLFDVFRDTAGHLALGHGIHYCLGAPLARAETEIALAALLDRFGALALAEPEEGPRWRPSLRARGLLGAAGALRGRGRVPLSSACACARAARQSGGPGPCRSSGAGPVRHAGPGAHPGDEGARHAGPGRTIPGGPGPRAQGSRGRRAARGAGAARGGLGAGAGVGRRARHPGRTVPAGGGGRGGPPRHGRRIRVGEAGSATGSGSGSGSATGSGVAGWSRTSRR